MTSQLKQAPCILQGTDPAGIAKEAVLAWISAAAGNDTSQPMSHSPVFLLVWLPLVAWRLILSCFQA